jgi:hypothetical protein
MSKQASQSASKKPTTAKRALRELDSGDLETVVGGRATNRQDNDGYRYSGDVAPDSPAPNGGVGTFDGQDGGWNGWDQPGGNVQDSGQWNDPGDGGY